jgi:hypothetical protein
VGVTIGLRGALVTSADLILHPLASKGGESADGSPSAEQAAPAELAGDSRGAAEDAAVSAGKQADERRSQRRIFEQ